MRLLGADQAQTGRRGRPPGPARSVTTDGRTDLGNQMTRIVAGALGGRRISAPPGDHTRPTSDRVREALFSALRALTDLAGARFADLFAGSGAVGLEALSRGAGHVLLVEADARAARVARENVAALDAADAVRLVNAKVEQVLGAPPPDGPYDVVFADPPYAVPDDKISAMLAALTDGGWLAPGAVVVVERSSRSPEVTWVPGITAVRSRRYGETTLWYGRRS
jgi:16S rRNA (guanine(966)-N(2))-methyltransferase RsmD